LLRQLPNRNGIILRLAQIVTERNSISSEAGTSEVRVQGVKRNVILRKTIKL
jgi:hypothetical protein